mmetsp:Transcript_32264/g.74506  ORF Transcript_32264/g.74506 Transcript_32264/m.74506 type:complete len:94 (+) Transcript_32264:1270-1551(+)
MLMSLASPRPSKREGGSLSEPPNTPARPTSRKGRQFRLRQQACLEKSLRNPSLLSWAADARPRHHEKLIEVVAAVESTASQRDQRTVWSRVHA